MSATAQSPAQEVMERLAEHSPARTLPFLLAVKNLQHTFGLSWQKNRDDHARERKMLGDLVGDEVPSMEPEEMGDITVAGDTTTTNVHHHYHATPPESKSTEAKSGVSGFAKKLLPVAVGAALPVGGFLLAQYFNRDTPTPAVVDTDTDTNTKYVIEALPGE